MTAYLIIVFDSTHYAIKTEKLMTQMKISGRLIPTPGNLRAGCGLSYKIDSISEKSISEKKVLTLLNEEIGRGVDVFKIEKTENGTKIEQLLYLNEFN